ncbi:hypothetical protein COXBURSA331_A0417 [Coxiella burnetii RSA 331]|uniref:Uncharacterized protein n=1 Tax=Coxiella burnetii (strain Dugway 5J108-111) TaxID=434922 RepID=A9KGQ7_COXBN|nr:hypothetical protein CBUD_1770 [Coxiella burnetii Dugway 5J108-111]ABX77754.1 hypothetical protein COXBURSA331_A0417 [Coxiella burnetii RSA 331]ACJ18972.1 hypothetical protein CbuG_1695 [Coxiella burnetii CbuG_Q212]
MASFVVVSMSNLRFQLKLKQNQNKPIFKPILAFLKAIK